MGSSATAFKIGIFGRLIIPHSAGESILIDLSLRYLSPPLIALMVGALLSAIMSSADSALLAPSSIIGHNIIPYFKPNASERLKLIGCKWSVPVIGLISLFLAVYFKNVYKLCQESWGILLTSVAAPMIAGVYWKKTNTIGTLFGTLAGSLAWILLRIFMPGDYPHNLFGFLISCFVLVIVSLITQKKNYTKS